MFLPLFSITTWWWQQQPRPQPLTTTRCSSTASCPTAPPPPLPPLPLSCTSTSQEAPQLLLWAHQPTGRAAWAVAAAWYPPAASATHTPHICLYTRAHTLHTHTLGWWPVGAVQKQLWQLFMVGYLMLYHWTDTKTVQTTLSVRHQSCRRQFDCRVKFNPETRLAPNHSEGLWSCWKLLKKSSVIMMVPFTQLTCEQHWVIT